MLCLVIGVSKYNFKNTEGQQISGVKVNYLDEKETSENAKGYMPIKITAKEELYPFFKVVPGLYDLDFNMKPDGKGKPQLVLKSVEFKKEVSLPNAV